jgi:hypothetical protein
MAITLSISLVLGLFSISLIGIIGATFDGLIDGLTGGLITNGFTFVLSFV